MVVGVRKAKGVAAAEANLGEDVLVARDEDTDGHLRIMFSGRGAGALPMMRFFSTSFRLAGKEKKNTKEVLFFYKDVCCSKEEERRRVRVVRGEEEEGGVWRALFAVSASRRFLGGGAVLQGSDEEQERVCPRASRKKLFWVFILALIGILAHCFVFIWQFFG